LALGPLIEKALPLEVTSRVLVHREQVPQPLDRRPAAEAS
jgi:hypothetical protein